MRLIFKGKILKDELTLDEYKIADGLTVHLVKGSNKGGASSGASANAGASSLNSENPSSSTNNNANPGAGA
jgi:ubiquilin